MRICRGRGRGGPCGRACDPLTHRAAAGRKPETICTRRGRRSKTPPTERVARTLPPARWGTENTPAGAALAMVSADINNVPGSVDDRRNTTRWRSRLRAKGDRGSAKKIGRSGERQQADECKPANVHSLALAATGDRLSAVAKKWGVAASASKPAILLSEVDRRVRGWPWRRYSAHGVRRPQRRQIRIFSRGRFELSVDPTRLR